MPDAPATSAARGIAPGIVAIAAAYIYFLLYAQFGLLHLLETRGAGRAYTDAAMGSMGLAGLLASVACAFLLRRVSCVTLLQSGFALSAASALAALWLPGVAILVVLAAFTGAGAALVTVPLASGLRDWLPADRMGTAAGWGTGLAYAFCNLPGIFDGPPARQVLWVVVACLAGFSAARKGLSSRPPLAAMPPQRPGEWTVLQFVAALLAFFLLVFTDATAFAVIQNDSTLKAHTWAGAGHQSVQGILHLAAAVWAGRMVDRGGAPRLWSLTAAMFLLALPAVQAGQGAVWAGPLYAAGISLYSVGLVTYPSLFAGGGLGAPARAAWMYGLAGWIGSAAGVGLAQHLNRIPVPLLIVTGLCVLPAWWMHARRGHAKAIGTAILLGLVWQAASGPRWGKYASLEERGRRVYIEEGCMHCHSQYVRPDNYTADALWWGPARPIDRTERPPLVGNRRQGPDLANVGARRSPEWLRLHFLFPELARPGSRMPGYGHLFAGDATRGEALLAYLATLGKEASGHLWAGREAWRLAIPAEAGDPGRGAGLFARSCSGCHGPEGKGDGPLADRVRRPALNLHKGAFQHVPAGVDREARRQSLARIVKFGVPATAMAGHETLPDQDVADLVSWLERLAP